MGKSKTWMVVVADGHSREFYCWFRATEYARKVQGLVDGVAP